DPDTPPREWKRRRGTAHVETSERIPARTAGELLGATRAEVRGRWAEIPEAFYGFAWLVVDRIVERRGLEGLYRLCQDAQRDGQAVVSPERILEAAELDLSKFTPRFLSSCFTRDELRLAVRLQPELFARAALEVLRPIQPAETSYPLLYRV